MHPAHPLGLVLGQVVVDGDDVDAAAGQRVQVGGQHGGQGLALAGLHLGDVAQVQRGAAHELDVEVPLAEHPAGGLADGGESLGQQLVQGLAVGVPLPELVGHRPQLGVGQCLEVVLDRVDLGDDRLELAQRLALASAKDVVDDGWHLSSRSLRIFPDRYPRLGHSWRNRPLAATQQVRERPSALPRQLNGAAMASVPASRHGRRHRWLEPSRRGSNHAAHSPMGPSARHDGSLTTMIVTTTGGREEQRAWRIRSGLPLRADQWRRRVRRGSDGLGGRRRRRGCPVRLAGAGTPVSFPSYHGRAVSWVAVSIIMVAFLVGGLALVFGPTWWLFWASLGLAAVGLLLALGDEHLRRLVLSRIAESAPGPRPAPGLSLARCRSLPGTLRLVADPHSWP